MHVSCGIKPQKNYLRTIAPCNPFLYLPFLPLSGEFTARLAWASARAGPPMYFYFIFFFKKKNRKRKRKDTTRKISVSLSHIAPHHRFTLSLSFSRILHHRSHSLAAPPPTVDRRRLCHNSQQPSSSVLLYSILRYQSQTLVFSNLLNLLYCKIILVESSQICCLCESPCC
jgi:hypothetical protein